MADNPFADLELDDYELVPDDGDDSINAVNFERNGDEEAADED